MSASIVIRAMDSRDAAAFQGLRLQALQECPSAFCSSYLEEASTPLSEIAARFQADPSGSWILGAFTPTADLVGMIGFRRERGLKHLHKAILWGMYVSPPFRRRKIGRLLLEECLARARTVEGLRQVKLSVMTSQEAAVELYLSLGFVRFGREPAALQVEDRYYDEDYMVLSLAGGRASG